MPSEVLPSVPRITAAYNYGYQQSIWTTSDICTVLFGCIASVLGVLTLWATIWLGRQRVEYCLQKGRLIIRKQSLGLTNFF